MPIASVDALDTLPASVVKPALDKMADDSFDSSTYDPDLGRFMAEWRALDGVATYDGDGAVMDPAAADGDMPRVWSYRALTQNKVPGAEPPPNPYNTKVAYAEPPQLVSSKANPALHTAVDAELGRVCPLPADLFPEG